MMRQHKVNEAAGTGFVEWQPVGAKEWTQFVASGAQFVDVETFEHDERKRQGKSLAAVADSRGAPRARLD